MRRCRNIRQLLSLAAVAVLGTLATDAAAQVRVDTGGANDASNRVGSYGRNDIGYVNPSYTSGRAVYGGDALDVPEVRGNLIVTGNVTNFKYFRGSVPYSDARDFRGQLGSASFDRFKADSGGVPLPNQGPTMATETRPFYGAALVGPPPAGFAEMGSSGIYTPAPKSAPPTGINSQLNTSFIESRLLEGRSTTDLLMMPGPVDPLTQLPSVLTASPMMGVRQWDMTSPSDRAFLSNYNGLSTLSPGQITLPSNEILQMQLDVARAAGRLPAGLAGQTQEQPLDTANLARPMPLPFDSPQSQNLAATPQANPLMQEPLTGQVRQEGSMASQLAVPPAQQSSQYSELQKRLDRYYTKRLETDEDRNRELIRQLKAREAQKQPPTPETPAPQAPTTPPQADPDYNRISQQLLQQKSPGIFRPEPVHISSLATGVKAEQLKSVLGKAEGLMQEGKYVSALEQYNRAGQVVPNNPLVMVGQAHAELAAGYYKQAEQHLRRAYETDPVLTMAQFDLKQMIGRDRLAALISDLKETARRQEKDAGPAFLLAYLAYNTGSEEQAGVYLDLAQKRAGENDKFYRLLKMNWAVPSNAPATQPANK